MSVGQEEGLSLLTIFVRNDKEAGSNCSMTAEQCMFVERLKEGGDILALNVATLSLKKFKNPSQASRDESKIVDWAGLKTDPIVLKRTRGLFKPWETKSERYLVFSVLTVS